jgi:hypothetical protein
VGRKATGLSPEHSGYGRRAAGRIDHIPHFLPGCASQGKTTFMGKGISSSPLPSPLPGERYSCRSVSSEEFTGSVFYRSVL